MASAVASNVHAGPAAAGAMSFGWLGPRLSFGSPRRDAVVEVVAAAAEEGPKAAEPAAISKDFIDFEFSLGGAATMLPADELFADGKLLPLRPQAAAAAGKAEPEPERERRDTALVAEIPPPSTPERVRAVHPAAAEASLDPYVFSPKAPTCSSRWRELLRLRKVQTPQKASPVASPSASPAPPAAATPSRVSSSSAARSLKLLLLQRNGGRASCSAASDLSAAPLLRDSSDSEASLSLASSRFSLSSSSSSSAHDHDDFPRHSLDSVDPTPRPRIRLVRTNPHAAPQPQAHTHTAAAAAAAAAAASVPARAGHSPARRRPSTPQPPPPPSVVSVESPRMNASGKIVFQGLERSSSSPAGSVHSSMRSRSRVMDRSYSAGVRATPVVLNVPVCSRPVFGFFKDKKDTAAKDAASTRPRSALGRRTTATPAPGGASCRDLGNGN